MPPTRMTVLSAVRLCYEAFAKISSAHGFPCDFPGPEATTGLLSMMFSRSDS